MKVAAASTGLMKGFGISEPEDDLGADPESSHHQYKDVMQ